MIEVKVPVLAESIPDATLLEWKKRAGDAVSKDELLIEVETDKVVLEVIAPQSGVIKEIVRDDGETVLSGEVIARIEAGAVAVPEATAAPQAQAQVQAEPAPAPAPAAKTDDEPALSPAARKLVAERSLDARQIIGTGRNGLITKEDVLNFVPAEASPPVPARASTSPAPPSSETAPASVEKKVIGTRSERREPMSRLRQRIAERLVQSQQTAAILTTFNEINMGPVMALRSRYKEVFEKTHGVRLGFMSFFAKASVIALQKFPQVNAYIEGNEVVFHDYCDIGIAVGSPRGLVVPILRNVEDMSFADVEKTINEYATSAQDGSLGLDALTGGTFTISNGGVFGSLLSTPIINPPQSAILGMHKTQDRPVAENGEVVIRPMMYLALSYDHRIVDGREAVQFLVTIKDALEDPGRMLLDV